MAEKAEDARRELRQLLIGAEVYPLVGAVMVPDWMARSAARNTDDGGQGGVGEVVRARAKLKEVGRNAAVAILRERGYVEARRERDLLEEEVKREEVEYEDYYGAEIRYRHGVATLVKEWLTSLHDIEGAEVREFGERRSVVVREEHLVFDATGLWSWRIARSDGDAWAHVVVKSRMLREWGLCEEGERFEPYEPFRINPPISEVQVENKLSLYVGAIDAEAKPHRKVLQTLLFRFENLRRVVAEYEMFGHVPEWNELTPTERESAVDEDKFIRRRNAIVSLLITKDGAGELRPRNGVGNWTAKDLFDQLLAIEVEEYGEDLKDYRSARRQVDEQLKVRVPWWSDPGRQIDPYIRYALEVAKRKEELGKGVV